MKTLLVFGCLLLAGAQGTVPLYRSGVVRAVDAQGQLDQEELQRNGQGVNLKLRLADDALTQQLKDEKCKDGEVKPNTDDCKKYYVCKNNVFVEESCGWFKYFDSVNRECIIYGATCAKADDNPTQPPATTPNQTPSGPTPSADQTTPDHQTPSNQISTDPTPSSEQASSGSTPSADQTTPGEPTSKPSSSARFVPSLFVITFSLYSLIFSFKTL